MLNKSAIIGLLTFFFCLVSASIVDFDEDKLNEVNINKKKKKLK